MKSILFSTLTVLTIAFTFSTGEAQEQADGSAFSVHWEGFGVQTWITGESAKMMYDQMSDVEGYYSPNSGNVEVCVKKTANILCQKGESRYQKTTYICGFTTRPDGTVVNGYAETKGDVAPCM